MRPGSPPSSSCPRRPSGWRWRSPGAVRRGAARREPARTPVSGGVAGGGTSSTSEDDAGSSSASSARRRSKMARPGSATSGSSDVIGTGPSSSRNPRHARTLGGVGPGNGRDGAGDRCPTSLGRGDPAVVPPGRGPPGPTPDRVLGSRGSTWNTPARGGEDGRRPPGSRPRRASGWVRRRWRAATRWSEPDQASKHASARPATHPGPGIRPIRACSRHPLLSGRSTWNRRERSHRRRAERRGAVVRRALPGEPPTSLRADPLPSGAAAPQLGPPLPVSNRSDPGPRVHRGHRSPWADGHSGNGEPTSPPPRAGPGHRPAGGPAPRRAPGPPAPRPGPGNRPGTRCPSARRPSDVRWCRATRPPHRATR